MIPQIVTKILTTIISLIVVIYFAWIFITGKALFINTTDIDKSFGQFITLEGSDEYVVAKLVSNEDFIKEKYNFVMGYPVGDTRANLSLVANYNYFVKLAELTHTVENERVILHVPKLYLSTPVAFEFSTVREGTSKFLFGEDEKVILDNLKAEVSGKLVNKGHAQVSVMYDKAAKALADNFNAYFKANGYGNYYKNIVVVFSNEKSQSSRQFNYNNSLCGNETCALELDLGKGLIFTIK